jgi:competence protein CoiA-like protein
MVSSPELLVPYGLADNGSLVAAASAIRHERYSCPFCQATLVMKDGPSGRVRKHFAHPSSGSCGQESIYHVIAKLLVERAILDNVGAQGRPIQIHCPCHECGTHASRELPPGTFIGAAQEHNLGHFRADVVGFGAAGVTLAVEVLHAHAIPQGKAASMPVRWVEVRASDVIANPGAWSPVRARIRPIYCTPCQDVVDRIHAACEKAGIPKGSYSVCKREHGGARYVASLFNCYGCHEEIAVFWWAGVPYCEHAPPEPRPRSIQLRQSQTYGGKYWANTCPHCRRIQGDNFLFNEPGAPLGALPLRDFEKSARHSISSILRHMLTRNF